MMNWASIFLTARCSLVWYGMAWHGPCTNCFIARASLSCSVLLRPCSATQPSPGRRHRLPGSSLACSFTALLLGLLLSGAVLWCVGCVGVPLVPLTHAVLGWCHGHTPEPDPCASNTWPGVGQGPCMQHTCVHSAIRMGTHASVSLAGCHDSDTAGTCPHTHTGTHPHVSKGIEGERSTARHGPAVLQINLRCTRVRVHVQREACARACVRVITCLVCVCPCRHSTLTAEPQHRHEPMTTGAATGSGMAQWKSVEDGWPPKRPGCQHTLAFMKANDVQLGKMEFGNKQGCPHIDPPILWS